MYIRKHIWVYSTFPTKSTTDNICIRSLTWCTIFASRCTAYAIMYIRKHTWVYSTFPMKSATDIMCIRSLPSKHCSTGTIPAQYRGYCRNGTGPPLFYCHLRNSDLPFCTSAFYRSGTGKLLPYRYQPAQLHYIASIIYMYWPGVWLALTQYRIYCWHGIIPELFNQCQCNEHMPLCAPAFYRTNTWYWSSTVSCFSTRTHLLCKGYTF